MNSLMSYGSDDDLDDSPEERTVDSHGRSLGKSSGTTPPNDTNYDEVQMSLSEDSDVESKQNPKSRRDRDDQRSSPKNRDSKETGQRDRRDDRSERDRYTGRDRNDDRNRRDRDDDRSRNRDEKEERGKSRDDDKTRDRYRDREEDRRDARRDDRRARSRDRYNSREDRHRQDRDRRRSRSPRDNRERKRSRSPKKSRSRSKERPNRTGAFQRRFDRGNRNIDQRQSNVATETAQNDDGQNKDRFFMPGITGRFRDQIEKRKLLWQKKEPGENPAPAASGAPSSAAQNPHAPKSTKIWQNTTFAQDTDGKVANKFKRLMGIRAPGDGENSANEALKKQDEMFSAMEQQYEVARTTTHTMRGVGLGFSSFNR